MREDLVWYVSYGSNMCAERFGVYLSGGVPAGGRQACPGARDARPPRRSVGCLLDGGVYFATESATWGGGRAFFDPDLTGRTPVRAHLVTAEQFCDVAAQEMYRPPGTNLDLAAVVADGRRVLGPGRYETLLHVGHRDGVPMLTFTAPWSMADVALVSPSGPYLRVLATGLSEGHGWDGGRSAAYLANLPGARDHWTPEAILVLL